MPFPNEFSRLRACLKSFPGPFVLVLVVVGVSFRDIFGIAGVMLEGREAFDERLALIR